MLPAKWCVSRLLTVNHRVVCRNQDLAEVEDPRVDVCLFCVPPHRLRPIDIR